MIEERRPRKDARPGELAMAKADITTLENESRHSITVTFDYDRFSCKDPFSGLTQHGHVTLAYVPGPMVVDRASLALYLQKFRDFYLSYEDATQRIMDDLVRSADPSWADLSITWHCKDGMTTETMIEYYPEMEDV